jgi:glycosyltransferase involved in cell wall biosynthesis
MKVLIVNKTNSGGAAIAAIRLHEGLMAQGIDSRLILNTKPKKKLHNCFILPNQESNFFLKILVRFRTSYTNYKRSIVLNKKSNGHYPFTFINGIRIDTEHIEWADIIHLHWIANYLKWKDFFLIKKPIVWTQHDMNPFTGGCHHSEECEKYRLSCKRCPQLHKDNNSFASKQLERKRHYLGKKKIAVISPSKWLSERSKSSSLFKDFKHHVIPNTYDDRFKYIDKQIAKKILSINDKKTILFVSQNLNVPLKGGNVLKKAITGLKDINIITVGSGSIDLDNVMNLDRKCDWLSLNIIYAAADLLIVPSLVENYPNIIIESLMSGTPVVAFKVGGIPEQLEDEVNGILVSKKNSKELKRGIEKGLQTKFDYELISRNTKSKYLTNYTLKRHIDLYRDIILNNAT